MKVKIWGCRGSLPTPIEPARIEQRITDLLTEFQSSKLNVKDFLAAKDHRLVGGFGGHTACIEVSSGSDSLIIDCGSGLRPLAHKLLGGPCSLGRGTVDILMTHFHWDHLIGLPFFIPIFIPGNRIRFHAVQQDLEKIIRSMFKKPYFPVPFEELKATIEFNKLAPRQPKKFGSITVTPYELDHPDPCWGYKFESTGRTFSYCVDTEAQRVSRKAMGEDLPLYQNVNLMIFDAQYTFKEATEKINWGHATGPVGLDIAKREGVERVYFVHHDPAASDEKILQAELQTKEYDLSSAEAARSAGKDLPAVEWSFAYEGLEVEV